MKRLISFFSLLMIAVFAAGCAPKYGEELYVCNPDNMIGIKGIYYTDDQITLVFDKEQAEDNDFPFDEEITFFDDDENEFSVKKSNTKEDKDILTVDCDYRKIDAEDIIRISYGIYTINLEEDSLYSEEVVNAGYNMNTYIQYYDKKDDSWSEVEYQNCQLICE